MILVSVCMICFESSDKPDLARSEVTLHVQFQSILFNPQNALWNITAVYPWTILPGPFSYFRSVQTHVGLEVPRPPLISCWMSARSQMLSDKIPCRFFRNTPPVSLRDVCHFVLQAIGQTVKVVLSSQKRPLMCYCDETPLPCARRSRARQEWNCRRLQRQL